MQIYDDDHKIITCDSKIVKIWEFDDDNPDIITSLPFEDKIDKFYAPGQYLKSGEYVYLGVFQEADGFKIYKSKLNEHWH